MKSYLLSLYVTLLCWVALAMSRVLTVCMRGYIGLFRHICRLEP